MISQELFDETVLENQEVFDLTVDEAVQETISQFSPSLSSNNDHTMTTCLAHLCLSHPLSTQGQLERQNRTEFVKCLTQLDAHVQPNGTIVVVVNDNEPTRLLDCLLSIHQTLSLASKQAHDKTTTSLFLAYLVLVQQHEALYTFLSLLGVCGDDLQSCLEIKSRHVSVDILKATLRILMVLFITRPNMTSNGATTTNAAIADHIKTIQAQLKDIMGASMERWMIVYKQVVDAASLSLPLLPEDDIDSLQLLLLQLAHVSCRANERNKTLWIRAHSRKGIPLLLSTLQVPLTTTNHAIHIQAANLLTVLCKFDDFRPSPTTTTAAGPTLPTVSSAHDHVLEFARGGAVPILYELLRSLNKEELTPSSIPLPTAILSALRVLAIQDDIVQSMVAVGVLPMALQALQLDIGKEDEQEPQQTAPAPWLSTAALGLLRNLSANDDIKTTLCQGSESMSMPSAVPAILQVMRQHVHYPLLQEHGCGTLAAMALRKPNNAEAIVQHYHGHVVILTAMRCHAQNVVVQRQGALAIRNLVSRATSSQSLLDNNSTSMREALLDAGAEQVLRGIAGRHQGSVDEAYAALRDLKCDATLLQVNMDDGSMTAQRPVMFGETKPNFRPVFEPSRGT